MSKRAKDERIAIKSYRHGRLTSLDALSRTIEGWRRASKA